MWELVIVTKAEKETEGSGGVRKEISEVAGSLNFPSPRPGLLIGPGYRQERLQVRVGVIKHFHYDRQGLVTASPRGLSIFLCTKEFCYFRSGLKYESYCRKAG